MGLDRGVGEGRSGIAAFASGRAMHVRFGSVCLYGWLSAVLLACAGYGFAGAIGALSAVLAVCGILTLLIGATVTSGSRSRSADAAVVLFAASVIAATLSGLPVAFVLPVACLAPVADAFARAGGRTSIIRGLAMGAAIAAAGAAAPALFPAAATSVPAAIPVAALYGGLLMRFALGRPAGSGEAHASDDLWRAVADGPPVMLLLVERNGEVVRVLDPSHDLLGIAPFLLTGPALLERVHLTDRVMLLNALDRICLKGGQTHLTIRVRLPASDDEQAAYRPLALTLSGRGSAGGVLVAMRDHDHGPELKERIGTLESQQGELEVAKSRFLASASHELRTPLNAIIGFADLMTRADAGSPSPEKQQEYAGLIRASGQHLLSVVNSILDMSRIEAGHYPIAPACFAICDAIDMSVSMVEQGARERGITLDVDIDPDCAELKADQRAVQQVLINLLSNAVKFTGEGGRVTIATDRYANWIRLSVRDTGIGMAPDFVEKLGTPFLQADNDYTRRHEGTGLGLSVVKGLIELHDGRMKVESTPYEGTCVTVSFPVDGPSVSGYGDAPTPIVQQGPTLPEDGDEEKNDKEEECHDAYRKSA